MKTLIISADNFEDTELLVPYYRVLEEGHDVDIASMKKGKIRGKKGYEVEANKALRDVNPDDYDLLILPGGNQGTTQACHDGPRSAKTDPASGSRSIIGKLFCCGRSRRVFR